MDSNMKEVYYKPDEYSQFPAHADGEQTSRKTAPTSTCCSVACWSGLAACPTLPPRRWTAAPFITYNNGDLIACFNENVPDSVIREIAKRQPLAWCSVTAALPAPRRKSTWREIFKLSAPNTSVKVL
jgi:adenine-specific DNA-methyltransferase